MAVPIRFYADEHVARAVVHGLRLRGVDVVRAVEAGMAGATDEEHLARAAREVRVVITQDADFLRLHALGAQHAGIIYAAQHTTVRELIRGVMLVYQVLTKEDMQNHVEFI